MELRKRKSSDVASEEVKDPTLAKRRVNMPKKNEHRMHAHINPFQNMNMPFPMNPRYADWSLHYPSFFGIEGNNKD